MEDSRRFSSEQRRFLFILANGKCQRCGASLGDNWEADHIVPWSEGGKTELVNGQALCQKCNREKGDKMAVLKSITATPRPWQEKCIISYFGNLKENFLAVATPGSGKTFLAFFIARRLFEEGYIGQVIIVVPSDNLREQWIEEAKKMGLELYPIVKAEGELYLPLDEYNGLITTYQQAAAGTNSDWLNSQCSKKQTLVVLDEIHHCGDSEDGDLRWGAAIKNAFVRARFRLLLSGTPFRSDNNPIPFVKYDKDNKSVTDYSYSYGQALQEEPGKEVVRQIYFPTYDGEMRWSTGFDEITATFQDELSIEEARNRLNTALYTQGGWLKEVIIQANKRLDEIRTTGGHPNAAGLIIAKDTPHATKIKDLMTNPKEGIREDPEIVIYQDPDARDKIAQFKSSSRKWIIAVRMISEGVDIPRLRVGVYATNTMTEIFFRQAMGRVVRWIDGLEDQPAWFYVPKVQPLLQYIKAITDEREHVLKEIEDKEPRDKNGNQNGDGQLKFYKPESSYAIEGETLYKGYFATPEEIRQMRQKREEFGMIDNRDDARLVILVKMFGGFSKEAEPEEITQQPQRSTPIIKELPKIKRVKNIKHELKSRIGRLIHLLEEKGIYLEHASIHSQWMKMGGTSQTVAPEVELQQKRDWLDSEIESTSAGHIPPWVYKWINNS